MRNYEKLLPSREQQLAMVELARRSAAHLLAEEDPEIELAQARRSPNPRYGPDGMLIVPGFVCGK